MDINKDLKHTIENARRGTADILDTVRKGTSDRPERVWDDTRDAMVKAREILSDVKSTLEIEAGATRDTVDEYVQKAEKVQVDLDLMIVELSETIKGKSVDAAELAVAKVRNVLDKAEELIDKAK